MLKHLIHFLTGTWTIHKRDLNKLKGFSETSELSKMTSRDNEASTNQPMKNNSRNVAGSGSGTFAKQNRSITLLTEEVISEAN